MYIYRAKPEDILKVKITQIGIMGFMQVLLYISLEISVYTVKLVTGTNRYLKPV